MTNQLEECIRAHNLFCQSRDLNERPSDDWIIELENFTAMWYGRIDEYIRTVNRPPSAVASNTGSSVHSIPISAHGNPVVPRSNPGSVHSNPVSVVQSDPDSIMPRNSASGAQHNTAADTHSIRSPVLSTLFENFQMPQRSHGTFSESSNILDDEITFDFEAVETLKYRLDQEKRARESLEQRFQPLQSNFEATHEEIERKNQTNAGMPSKNDVDFLMNTVRHWQASQDQEKERRISLEQKLEKHRRELEEEKRARQADIHRFER